jgi:hypothetical protein
VERGRIYEGIPLSYRPKKYRPFYKGLLLALHNILPLETALKRHKED